MIELVDVIGNGFCLAEKARLRLELHVIDGSAWNWEYRIVFE
jgi:hypothetical protein